MIWLIVITMLASICFFIASFVVDMNSKLLSLGDGFGLMIISIILFFLSGIFAMIYKATNRDKK